MSETETETGNLSCQEDCKVDFRAYQQSKKRIKSQENCKVKNPANFMARERSETRRNNETTLDFRCFVVASCFKFIPKSLAYR